jgi:hypothetical protein
MLSNVTRSWKTTVIGVLIFLGTVAQVYRSGQLNSQEGMQTLIAAGLVLAKDFDSHSTQTEVEKASVKP